MQERRIGSLAVSVAGIGCNNFGWRIDARQTAEVVNGALEAGINFFDTADIYGNGQSEEFLGRALKGNRERAVIATKFGYHMGDFAGDAKPAYIRSSVEGSLRRLQTDVIDLYQIHRPDPATPIGDTLAALDVFVQAGTVREIGCSNFSAAQLREAEAAVRQGAARFVSVQNEYSLLNREPESEVLPECARQGLAFLPFFPLANGLLTGKYRAGEPWPEASRGKDGFGPKVFTAENLRRTEAWAAFAAARGHTLLELAFAFLLARPEVASVIAGAKTAAQAARNASAAGWRLSASNMAELSAA